MNAQTKLNISSIIGLKEGIHQIFSLIEHDFDIYAKYPSDHTLIDSCLRYFHQLDGLLEMLELDSITSINAKIEQLMSSLIENKTEASPEILNTLKEMTHALHNYLDELIEGKKDNPLRLFPAYQELMHAAGFKNVSECDLFFPQLITEPPLQTESTSINPFEIKSLAKQARTEYQAGLLKWLRDTSNKESLQQMVHAASQIEQFPGSVEQRTFWWVATGFLDNLLQPEADIDLSIRRICGKIEQAMRHLADGTPGNTAQLTREILYQIAHTDSVSERISDIKNAYDWPTQDTTTEQQDATLPLSLPLTLAETEALQKTLETMQNTLTRANENWREFCLGQQESLTLLSANCEQLKHLAISTDCAPLEKLIIAIKDTVEYLQTHSYDMNEGLAMEMASALLLVESTLENFDKLPTEFSNQVDTLAARLNAITQGTEHDEALSVMPKPAEIEHDPQEIKLQAQAAQEILTNLGQIEGVLDKFFVEPTERSALPTLSPLFKQIEGVFAILDLENANTLLNLCHDLATKLVNPEYIIHQTEQNLLADGLSSLGFFVEALKNGQPDSQRIIDAAITLFECAVIPEAEAETTPPVSLDEEMESDIDLVETTVAEIDPELLDVFLEEADEVLTDIADCLQTCHVNPTDIEALAGLCRGFHTLKGSSRMVKLTAMSDVAWRMEEVLELWLNERKFATQELLDVIKSIQQEFNKWCDELKQFGRTEVNADDLLLIAENLISTQQQTQNTTDSEDTEGTEGTIPPTHVVESPAADMEQLVTIGDLTIPFDLFEIYKTESCQHLATLNNELKQLVDVQDTTINQSFVLAAHTLASISNTLGLTFIAEPGFALEQWLAKLMDKNVRPDESGMQLIQDAITHLSSMQETVHAQQLLNETQIQANETLTQELIDRLKMAQQSAATQEAAEAVTHPSTESFDRQDEATSDTPSIAQETTTEQQTAPSEGRTEGEINAELLPIFLEEAQALAPQIGGKLRAWRVLPEDSDIHRALLRLLHTLKGSAHMAGVHHLGELIHHLEGDVEAAFTEHSVATPTLDKLEIDFDIISEQIEQLQIAETSSDTLQSVEMFPSVSAVQPLPSVSPEDLHAPQQKTMLRINAELIDQLVNESGEVSISRSKIETQLNNFKQSLQDLTDSVDRLHGQLREVEIQAETQMQSHLAQKQDSEQTFDPLEFDRFTRFHELTRLMAESVDDVMTVQKNLRTTHNTAEEAVTQQALTNRKLQQALMRIRTLQFGSFAERYYRIVRQAANDVGNKASLQIQGNEIEIDRSVLDKINSPLEHLLRNAVVHGIESSAKRIQLSKPEIGQIEISLRQEGNEVIITLSDDGSGLDIPQIREKAIQLGLIQESEVLDNDQIMSLIYRQGLSTADTVTGIAGRGIGMDIVKNEISALGGRITVHSEINQGTTFHIHLPLTLAVAQTLLVRTGQQIHAIPTVIVDHIQEVDTETLNKAYQNHQIEHNGKTYPFSHLSHLLGDIDHPPEIKRHNRILLLQSSTVPLAIHIDELIGNSEVVVKSIGPQLAHAPGIEGATVTGDGEVILILNPVKLIQREDAQEILTAPPSKSAINTQKPLTTVPTVMVVDDSLTVRRVTCRLLEREGCEVLIAKNGLDAIELLREITPDVMLIDLEMPKMDGFELIRNIRNNPDTANIPIIIISSRTADKHRAMAEELGVNIFLGKPYQEEELLEHITKFLQK
jgi:chemosensory pili system protein ChpA (sensor histidine kinase/response regulator)